MMINTVLSLCLLLLTTLQAFTGRPHLSIGPPGRVKAGTSVTLTCSSSSSSIPHSAAQSYSWYKVGSSAALYRSSLNNTYTFNVIRPEDSGDYYCEEETTACGTQRSGPVNLSVEYGPRNTKAVVDPPGQIREGSRVTLTCSTDANPPAHTYSWSRKEGSTLWLYIAGQNLVFDKIRPEDCGDYFRCRAVNTIGQQHSPVVSVQISYGPENTKVLVTPSDQMREGSRVTLTCSTDAHPPPHTYRWYRAGIMIPQEARENLTLSKIQLKDLGQFYCQAQNIIGYEDSPAVSLQISYNPKNTKVVVVDPPGQIREGSRVTMTCSTDANPRPHSYRWYRAERMDLLDTKENLTFSKIQPENRGQYCCRAVNTLGHQDSPSVSVDVLFGPKNTKAVVIPSDQIREGSRVTLTCSTDANPPPHTYSWYKADTMIPLEAGENLTFSNIQPEIGESTPREAGENLTLSNIQLKDLGPYYCRAVNMIGQQHSPVVSVQVSYKPEKTAIVKAPTGVIHKGASVSLTCSSDANPPVESYTWFKVNESTPVGSRQQFTIYNIRSEDAGQYYCEARNTHGAENSPPVSITVEAGQSHLMFAVVAVAVCGALCLLGVIIFVSVKCSKEGGMQSGRDQVCLLTFKVLQTGSGQPDVINLNSNTIQPDLIYQNLNPDTIQPDAVYQSLNPNTTQPDAVYQRLNPNTTQPDAVYQRPNPNLMQSTRD